MTAAESSLSPESRRFEFKRCLGVGGFGEVYLARMVTSTGLSRDVAVKLLLAALDSDSALRLRDEARLLAALNHRAILQIYDLLHLDGRAALVTEYVDGLDLAGVLGESGTLPPKLALEIVGEVAGALSAALTTPAPGSGRPLGLVHRDIKPANIRIARSGAIKLLDFGIAVSAQVEREAKTGTGLIVGTMGYLAPERITDPAVRPPSDIYALGCVLYEALVGERLFAGVSQSQALLVALHPDRHDAFLDTQLDRVERIAGPRVRRLLTDTLAFDPNVRLDAAALERACEELGSELPGPAVRRWARERQWTEPPILTGRLDGRTLETVAVPTGPVPPAPSPRKAKGSGRVALLAALGVGGAVSFAVLVAVGFGAYALTASKDEPTPRTDPPVAEVTPPNAADEERPAPPSSAPTTSVPPPATAAPPAPARPPVTREPSTRPGPSTPAPAAPAAPAAPIATEPVEPTGTVAVTGGIPVQLRAGGRTRSTGEVPAGVWQIWADFGAGFANSGQVSVPPDGTVTIRCSAVMMACKVE